MKNIHSRSFHILVLSLSSCHNHSPTRSFIFVKNTTLPVRLELETTSTGVPSRFLTTDCATIKLAEKKILRKLEFKVRVLSVLFNTVEFGVCFDITSWVAKTSFFFSSSFSRYLPIICCDFNVLVLRITKSTNIIIGIYSRSGNYIISIFHNLIFHDTTSKDPLLELATGSYFIEHFI